MGIPAIQFEIPLKLRTALAPPSRKEGLLCGFAEAIKQCYLDPVCTWWPHKNLMFVAVPRPSVASQVSITGPMEDSEFGEWSEQLYGELVVLELQCNEVQI